MEDKQRQAIEVYDSFFSVTRQLKKLAYQSAVSLGLTVHQIGILNSVRTNPGQTQKEVTERMIFAKSRVSIHIDSLVEKGLVLRQVSELDRRETRLTITPAGEELCARYNGEALPYKALESALPQFSREEIESLILMHQRLLSRL
ncbi:MarR family winged helix-turn-helix transcriptional regulator [Cohnella endophytica]|nr:MarR family transcriptional regulator [Cohnella endophytica]